MRLVEFLLARIAEDEEAARACAEMFPPPWEVADRGWRVRIYSSPVPDEGDHAEPGDEKVPCVMEVEPAYNYDDPKWLSERVEHVRRHDPARVLAECEAKRRIVSEHELGEWRLSAVGYVVNADGRKWEQHYSGAGCGRCLGDYVYDVVSEFGEDEPEYCDTLRILASVYADHPDYREEWKP